MEHYELRNDTGMISYGILLTVKWYKNDSCEDLYMFKLQIESRYKMQLEEEKNISKDRYAFKYFNMCKCDRFITCGERRRCLRHCGWLQPHHSGIYEHLPSYEGTLFPSSFLTRFFLFTRQSNVNSLTSGPLHIKILSFK